MPTARLILGQNVSNAANAVALLFTVAAATDAVVSSVVVTNTTAAALTFRIVANPTTTGLAAIANAIAWDVAIPANSIVTLNLGITLQAAAQIVVAASAIGVTFTAFGQNNT